MCLLSLNSSCLSSLVPRHRDMTFATSFECLILVLRIREHPIDGLTQLIENKLRR
jgi:hypothetical protein